MRETKWITIEVPASDHAVHAEEARRQTEKNIGRVTLADTARRGFAPGGSSAQSDSPDARSMRCSMCFEQVARAEAVDHLCDVHRLPVAGIWVSENGVDSDGRIALRFSYKKSEGIPL